MVGRRLKWVYEHRSGCMRSGGSRRRKGFGMGLLKPVFVAVLLFMLASLQACTQGAAISRTVSRDNQTEHAEAPAPLYDEDADGRQQLAQAMARAGKERKRVLVVWGANWCPWCRHLQTQCEEDEKIQALLSDNYVEVHIDLGTRDKHMDLAKEYGLEFNNLGIPHMSILDANGDVVANLNGEDIAEEVGKGEGFRGSGSIYSKAGIAEFLSRHRPG